MNENFKPKEYEYSCMKCNENIVLESEEIEKGEFNCPECGEINKIDIKNLKEIIKDDESEEIAEVPRKKMTPGQKKYMYISLIILIALGGFYYFAQSIDAIKFINAKGKADKHTKVAFDMLQRMMDNPQVSPDTLNVAYKETEIALDFDKENFEAIYLQAMVLLRLGKYNESILLYDKLIIMNPEMPEFVFNRAIAKLFTGDLQGSLTDMNKTLEVSPDLPLALFQRASLYTSLKNYKASIGDYNKLVQLGAEYADVFYGRGIARLEDGQKDSACYDFAKAKSLGYQGPDLDSLIRVTCGNKIPKVEVDSTKRVQQ